MDGDLRDADGVFPVPLGARIKFWIYSGYVFSIFLFALCILSLFSVFFINAKIRNCINCIDIVDKKIAEFESKISDKIKERQQAEKIMDWTHCNLALQPFLVQILEVLPIELKIKTISTTILEEQYRFELILDIIGKKHASLQYAKEIEHILNTYGYKSTSSSTMELVSGNRLILTAHII